MQINNTNFYHNNTDTFPIFAHILGATYEISQKIIPMLIWNYKKFDVLENPKTRYAEIIVSSICSDNIQHLMTALTAFEADFTGASANSLRHVFESIPKMFYIFGKPEVSELIVLRDTFKICRVVDKYKCGSNGLQPNSSDIFTELFEGQKMKFRRVFDHDETCAHKFATRHIKYAAEVYDGATLDTYDLEYGILCSYAHPSLTMHVRQHGISIVHLISCAFYNLYLQYNACFSMLTEIGESEFLQSIESILNVKNSSIRPIALYPTKPRYTKNLFLKL